MNISKIKSNSAMTNPLFIVIILLLGLIIVLSIFRTASPFLSIGFGINAHIGDLKGSFELETFDNMVYGGLQDPSIISLSPSDESQDPSCTSPDDSTAPLFIMYYAEWCGHCKRTMPHFNKLIENYKGDIKIIAVNSEDEENKDLIKSQNIKGFPTIRYYPSGISSDAQEYNGERSYNDFMQYLSSKNRSKRNLNPMLKNNKSGDSKNALFIMYYAEWCGHCKRTMPEFNRLLNDYKGDVKIVAINSEDDKHKDLIKSQNIKGFPTIRYYPSGISADAEEYSGGRTYNDFIQYLNSI